MTLPSDKKPIPERIDKTLDWLETSRELTAATWSVRTLGHIKGTDMSGTPTAVIIAALAVASGPPTIPAEGNRGKWSPSPSTQGDHRFPTGNWVRFYIQPDSGRRHTMDLLLEFV